MLFYHGHALSSMCRSTLQLEMCLVINKIDRLITELGLDPSEAHTRIKAVIAHVNMIVSSFHSGDLGFYV